jgi:ornithine carbamoyltransferase
MSGYQWASRMPVWEERIALLSPYQVNTKGHGDDRQSHAKFLHCLPAFHNRDTEVGRPPSQGSASIAWK